MGLGLVSGVSEASEQVQKGFYVGLQQGFALKTARENRQAEIEQTQYLQQQQAERARQAAMAHAAERAEDHAIRANEIKNKNKLDYYRDTVTANVKYADDVESYWKPIATDKTNTYSAASKQAANQNIAWAASRRQTLLTDGQILDPQQITDDSFKIFQQNAQVPFSGTPEYSAEYLNKQAKKDKLLDLQLENSQLSIEQKKKSLTEPSGGVDKAAAKEYTRGRDGVVGAYSLYAAATNGAPPANNSMMGADNTGPDRNKMLQSAYTNYAKSSPTLFRYLSDPNVMPQSIVNLHRNLSAQFNGLSTIKDVGDAMRFLRYDVDYSTPEGRKIYPAVKEYMKIMIGAEPAAEGAR